MGVTSQWGTREGMRGGPREQISSLVCQALCWVWLGARDNLTQVLPSASS